MGDAEIGLMGLQQVISCMSERRYSSKKARFRSVKDRHVTKLERENTGRIVIATKVVYDPPCVFPLTSLSNDVFQGPLVRTSALLMQDMIA